MSKKPGANLTHADSLDEKIAAAASGDLSGLGDVKVLQAACDRAEAGDETAMSAFREMAKVVPGMWDVFSNLAEATENAVLKRLAGDNLPAREGMKLRLQDMRVELAGPVCSPLERLLVERVVACWLQMQYADAMYAQRSPDLNLVWTEHYQQRQDRTHRRFLSACKSLAQVRKLALPVLQVNIGDKQVNIAHAEVSAGQAIGSVRALAGRDAAATV